MNPSALLEKSVSGVGLRFMLTGILPTAILMFFVVALIWSGAPSDPPDLKRFLERAAKLDPGTGFALAVATLTIALMANPFQVSMVRLLEGYWGVSWLSRILSAPFIRLQRWKRNKLRERKKDSKDHEETIQIAVRLHKYYPSEHRLLPMTLGNVLRAAEENAGKAYGLDIVTIWPRLYPLLSEGVRSVLDDQRNQLDIAARYCVSYTFASFVSLVLLIQYPTWFFLPFLTALLTWVSYRGAIASALSYGEGLRAALDLHRFDLLKALHLPLPPDLEAEKHSNEALTLFLRQGFSLGKVRYEHYNNQAGGEREERLVDP